MHFADAVSDAGVKQNALRRCGLTGVDVRHDSDIPATIQWYLTRHGILSLSREMLDSRFFLLLWFTPAALRHWALRS
jgi:hypothetical protein